MTGRVAIVTGGLTGIGLASAKALIAAGHQVAVGSRRGRDDALADQAAKALGPDAFIGALDVRSQSSIDAFTNAVVAHWAPAQILVNAAGIYQEAALPGHPDAPWDDQIDINLNGTFRMTRTLFAGMQAAGWGRIVNIASTSGSKGGAGYAAYCASKAGVIALSKVTAIEGAPHGITCVSLSPTWVETPMMDASVERHPATTKAALKSTNPQNRLVQPEEVAALVAFCCSDQAPALTNEDIQVNAGADW